MLLGQHVETHTLITFVVTEINRALVLRGELELSATHIDEIHPWVETLWTQTLTNKKG
jgi:hypothetical protein